MRLMVADATFRALSNDTLLWQAFIIRSDQISTKTDIFAPEPYLVFAQINIKIKSEVDQNVNNPRFYFRCVWISRK